MSATPITDAANKISKASPNIRNFALLVAAELEPPTTGLPVYELTLTPNWSQPSEQSPLLNAVWLYATSANTPAKAPNGSGVGRYLDFQAQDEWWIVVNRYWPSSFDPNVYTGGFGTEANGHNVAGDNGNNSSSSPNGGVGWGFGSGVSALRVGWNPGDPSPCVMVEPAKSGGLTIPLPVPQRDTMNEYLLHLIAGRADGTTPRAGALTVTANGVLVSNGKLDTVQRAQGPDGKMYTQRWMQWWDGDYGSNLSAPSTTRFQLTRFGATQAAAYADVPQLLGDNIASQVWNGKAPNVGPPTVKVV
jgi:hypothetical protein